MSLTPIFQEGVNPTKAQGVVWRSRGEGASPPHFHGQLEFLLVRSGSARLKIGTKDYALSRGSLAVLLPGITHFTSQFSADFDMWVVGFEPEHVRAVSHTHGFGSSNKSLSLLDARLENASPFSGWLLSIAQHVRGCPVLRPERYEFELLDDLCHRQSALQNKGIAPPEVDQILTKVFELSEAQADYGSALSLPLLAGCLLAQDTGLGRTALCKSLDISPSYLARLFKQELGLPMSEYRSRARVAAFLASARRGASLLSSSLSAGFGSYSQLYRTFSQVTGCRPQDYVEQQGRERLAAILLTSRSQQVDGDLLRVPRAS